MKARATAVALLATLLAAVPGHAHSAAGSHSTMGAETEIVSAGNGVVDVELPAAVRFRASGAVPHPTVTIDGDAGFAAVVLVEAGRDLPGALLAGRIDRSVTCQVRCMPGSGEIVVRSQGLARDGADPGSSHVLPAGHYRLFVLSTGGPVTVRLSFPELAAHDEPPVLSTAPHAAAAAALAGTQGPERLGGTLAYAGASGTLTGTGLLFSYVEAVGQVSTAGSIYTCEYSADEPPGAYAPTCPGGVADPAEPWVTPNAVPVGYRVTRHAFRTNVPPGAYGLGGGHVNASDRIETFTAVAVWLSW